MSRWSPAQEHPIDVFRRYTQQVDRWFDRMLDQWGGSGSTAGGMSQGVRWPALETFDRGNELVIRAEMPGMRRDDVRVEMVGDVLTIEGERRSESEAEGGRGMRRESCRFYREIAVPPDLDGSRLRARMDDGVLELTLPYREERRARQIEIESGRSEPYGSERGTRVSERGTSERGERGERGERTERGERGTPESREHAGSRR
jgi:HSP20 family protein